MYNICTSILTWFGLFRLRDAEKVPVTFIVIMEVQYSSNNNNNNNNNSNNNNNNDNDDDDTNDNNNDDDDDNNHLSQGH